MYMKNDDLSEKLYNAGLSQGDTTLVHSSLVSMAYQLQGDINLDNLPRKVFQSIQNVVGKDGTIIVPTFDFSFCDESPDGYWSLEESSSEMGILTEYVRNLENSTRTVHPFYSFSISGKHSDRLGRIHSRDSFSRDYIFGKIHDMDAKIVMIGIDYTGSMTFFHYVEQQEGVKYRYKKGFRGTINIRDKEYFDEYYMLVRDIDRGIKTRLNPMGRKLEKNGVIKKTDFMGTKIRVGSSSEIYDATSDNMYDKKYRLYEE